MILELNGTKVTIVDKTLGYQGDNLVDTIQVTVDKDSTWNYKLDMYKGKSKCFDSVLMTREGNICTVQLTNEILSYGGRYIFQLRGYTDTQTYHSDIFESWVNASIEYQDDCKQTDCGCDCKLPTEFYQVEDNVTEINNHPPYPGDNGKWMIWDVDRHEYVESDIDVVGGGGGDYQTKANLTTSITAESTNEQYPSAKATYDYGQSIAQSAGKINAITVNGTAQTVEDKTAKIIVNKSTVGLGNVNNTSDENKPVSTPQATAIADAKKAGTDAQAAVANLAEATQTALNTKLAKSDVVAVTLSATAGQAADAKSVYDALQALPTGTDISLGLTGAAVGDIIKVKAVDASGKPTAWEAANSAVEIANGVDVSAVSSFEYSSDLGGNAIKSNHLKIVLYAPNATVAKWLQFKFNDLSFNVYCYFNDIWMCNIQILKNFIYINLYTCGFSTSANGNYTSNNVNKKENDYIIETTTDYTNLDKTISLKYNYGINDPAWGESAKLWIWGE